MLEVAFMKDRAARALFVVGWWRGRGIRPFLLALGCRPRPHQLVSVPQCGRCQGNGDV